MTEDDRKIWERVSRTCRPVGTPDTDPFSVPMHITHWPKASPKNEIDLHGLTLMQAFDTVISFLLYSKSHKVREVTIVTGRSGQICSEFPMWVRDLEIIRSIRKLPNGGSYKVELV